tara:strand:- start:1524 stop:2192 length:669 start_codon:yes stop_codon:yes gene_type:complete
MIRLSVDTSFEHLGVCLTSNGECLSNYYSLCNRKNSSIIFKVIDELLKNAEIKLADIDAYIVNRGPGSYTGVRIAMGVVKTFAQVHQKPIIPVDSLELLAGQISSSKEDFSVLLNCTRKEIFHAKYSIINGKPEARTPIQLTSLEMFLDNSRDKAVVLHRVNPLRRKVEPLFAKLKLLSLDYPIADAFLLDRIGNQKLNLCEIDFNTPVNPLYVKRDVEKKE